MAILTLSSSNKNFSWIISKNPANPMTAVSIRKGQCLSWFSEENIRVSYFIDPPQENSYSNKDYSYLDCTSMVSPLAYLNIISEDYRSVSKSL